MTYEQKGMYIELLCIAWEQDPPGTLPDDNVVVAKYLGLLPEYWARHRATVLAAFYPGEDGRWHQKRMEKEAQKASHRVLSAKANIAKRWEKNGRNTSASNTPVLLRASASSEDSAESSSEAEKKKEPSVLKKKKVGPYASRPESKEELIQFVTEHLALPMLDAKALWDHWMGNGFKVNGRAMNSWKHTASNWERRGIFFPSLDKNSNSGNLGFAK